MKKFKTWYRNNRKKANIAGAITIVLLIVITFAVVLNLNTESVTVRSDEIIAEVNVELNKQVETYLDGVKNPDEATINFDDVDITKLGEYEGNIQYKDETYVFKFIVKDTVKPLIATSKENFTFSLDNSIDDVNMEINESLTITDNYDEEFEPIQIIDEMPESETEVKVAISIKDTSDNVSDPVTITVQFTEDGQEKEDLETVEKTASDPFKPQPKKEAPVEPEESDSDLPTSGNGNDEGKSEHYPTPNPGTTPPPPPPPSVNESKPDPQPSVPEYSTPEGCFDLGLFNSKQEGVDEAYSIIDDVNSPYYNWDVRGGGLSNGQWHFYLKPRN